MKENQKKYVAFSNCLTDSHSLEKKPNNIIVDQNDCSLTFRNIFFDNDILIFENQLIYFPDDKGNREINICVKKLSFIDCKFSANTFFKDNLDELNVYRSVFENRCYINNQYEENEKQIGIKKLIMKNTTFEKNFKLHNSVIDYFEIRDTDFYKNADFFKTIFKSGTNEMINFNAINFHELALFGDTEFHQLLQFKYVTFKGYSHFRSAYFYQGFDLEYANIEKEMNFFNIQGLDSKNSKGKTSQETYRIIKYQLQKVGNIIGANKYHSLELSKRRQKLPIFSLDYLVLFIHWITSNHSQNWLLPLLWIFVVGFITCWGLADIGYGYCSYKITDIFKYISIVNFDDCIKKDPVIFVLNKVLLGYLYYQFLTAIRKDTRK